MIILRFFFLFLYKNLCCGYSLEVPWQGDSMVSDLGLDCLLKPVCPNI